ncbi:MAG: tyrosine-type recombinase/integrase [Deltaproteobacteria bacterium]|nr:tyrosine-type recombinase/integrase [Deltaproteobacteria bacterium]
MRRLRFHDLRHSFASWLIANNEPLKYVQELLGHHSIQITIDTCGHLFPDANRQAVNRLDEQFPLGNSGITAPQAHPAETDENPSSDGALQVSG